MKYIGLVIIYIWLVCPFLILCQQREGESCREPDLPCDRKAGLHCSPKPSGICQECGVNNLQNLFDIRIVGGKPTDPKAWPWMAGITKESSREFPFCGGTLITDRHVLSAAHCLVHFLPNQLRVRLGEHDFSKSGDNSPMDFEIEKMEIHEKYDSSITNNDIAIITLKTEVKFNEFIWPACLPQPNLNIVNQVGLVAGWGTIYFEGPTNSVLHEAPVKVWNQDDCTKAYADKVITDNMMCCGWVAGKIDSCRGDSGGPFMTQVRGDRRWILAGIVSWGTGCASPNLPGVYAKVINYLDWIESHKKSVSVPAKLPIKGSDCIDGYEDIGQLDWCVKVNTRTINWRDAVKACASEGGRLAIVDTREKQAAISNLIIRKNIPDLWIGLSDTLDEGKFTWVDGSPLGSQTSWGNNQPDAGDENEDCVHFSSSWGNKWNDVTCFALFQYLCEKNKKPACPAGWFPNAASTNCYHIGEETLSFDNSVAYCSRIGGSLAIIPNSAEMSFARELLNQNNIKEVWIGLRRNSNGNFAWINNIPLTFQSWTANQPDNYLGMEGCVAMDQFYKYLWNDDTCTKSMKPMCTRQPSDNERTQTRIG